MAEEATAEDIIASGVAAVEAAMVLLTSMWFSSEEQMLNPLMPQIRSKSSSLDFKKLSY